MAESIAKEEEGGGAREGETGKDAKSAVGVEINRKEKRKEMKKMKRRQLRKEMAEKEREQEEAKLNDPEEQRRAMELEEEEKRRMERDRKEFEERERKWLEEMEKRRKEEEEEESKRALEEEEDAKRLQVEKENCDEDDCWEYVEEGPAEIIWKGNEIIVRKKRVKVPKKNADEQSRNEASDRPTSNPLPPQSTAFADYHSASTTSAEQLLENVAQQVPNFGTEQDKAHCPFHLKTGACRFGQRCSRVHFYPDKACTLLMKNMYNGPGLAWEQDEGLEVCKNSSFHLRGNVYVQYKSLDSAVVAYHSFNGRYFAGKQVQCEYINVTRWKVAICGEYMKSRLKECSRGTACNFIHCFRNPGGDYEWADWDKPPPRYWVKKMAALFGYSDECRRMDPEKTEHWRMSSRKIQSDTDRFHSTRSRSSDIDHLPSSGKKSKNEYDFREGTSRFRDDNRKGIRNLDEKSYEEDNHHSDHRSHDSDSDIGSSDKDFDVDTERKKRRIRPRIRSKQQDEMSEQSPDWAGGKTKDWEADSDEWSEENRSRQARHAHSGSSGHRKTGASLESRGRENHHGHTGRSPRHQGKIKSADNLGDGKESYRDKGGERRVHPRKNSSRHQSNFLDDHWDDKYRTHDTDSSELLDKDEERYQTHKRRHGRKSDEDVSDDEGFGAKRSKKNYREETETGKSHLKRKKTGGDSSIRSHSSRRSIERNSDVENLRTRENHSSYVDHSSSRNPIEQDRWKPDSSDRDQNSV
ncbi:zinc finger CCCH domain-containing protein 5 isoform X2 [Euphorbia lathyris]|uniref:zinc finger CCCH domain-containing protein 5 isoform X2 n=1 Tax=Euphorbia lathyris TaxID=212925 RepID=UPI0033139269